MLFQQLLDAAIDVIPLEERVAYTEAQVQCPALINVESNPIHWIRYEKFNLWAAARRLVKYWEWRKIIFGDRAYFPLLCISRYSTDNCALDEDDMTFLQTGTFARLPTTTSTTTTSGTTNNKFNSFGMPNQHQHQHQQQPNPGNNKKHAVFMDRTRIPHHYESAEKALRLPFYFFTQVIAKDSTTNEVVDYNVFLTEQQQQQSSSVVFIDLFTSMPRHKLLIPFTRMAKESLPIDLEPLIVAVPYSTKKSYFQSLLPAAIARLGQLVIKDSCVILIGDSKLDLQRKLEDMGFCKDCLPQAVGGTWTYDRFYDWYQQERNAKLLPAAPAATTPRVATLLCKTSKHVTSTTTSPPLSNYTVQLTSDNYPVEMRGATPPNEIRAVVAKPQKQESPFICSDNNNDNNHHHASSSSGRDLKTLCDAVDIVVHNGSTPMSLGQDSISTIVPMARQHSQLNERVSDRSGTNKEEPDAMETTTPEDRYQLISDNTKKRSWNIDGHKRMCNNKNSKVGVVLIDESTATTTEVEATKALCWKRVYPYVESTSRDGAAERGSELDEIISGEGNQDVVAVIEMEATNKKMCWDVYSRYLLLNRSHNVENDR